jgi:hypothetical protein
MNLKCAVGLHTWSGCKCSKCGKTRDQDHDWSSDCDKCAQCGKTRTDAHRWSGCKCSKCGKTRDQDHDWSSDCDKCAQCGKTRIDAHTWSGCKCPKCGKTRDQDHDWSSDCDKCAQCGKTRTDAHTWSGCKCPKCGKTRDQDHDWSSDCVRCAKCGRLRPGGHQWAGSICSNCGVTKETALRKLRETLASLPKPSGLMHGTFRDTLDRFADTLVDTWEAPRPKQKEVLTEIRRQVAASRRLAGDSRLRHLVASMEGGSGGAGTNAEAAEILEQMCALFPQDPAD